MTRALLPALAAALLSGCACPSIAYIDSVTVILDDVDSDDTSTVWELEVTADSEAPCTISINARGPGQIEDDCEGALWVLSDNRDRHLRLFLNDFAPRNLTLVLRAEGVEHGRTTTRPDYSTHSPHGEFCGGSVEAVVHVGESRGSRVRTPRALGMGPAIGHLRTPTRSNP